VARRTFRAVRQYAFGLRGRPCFKGYREPPLDRRQKQRGRDPLPCRQDRVEGPFDPGHVRSSETATAGKSPHSPPRRNTAVSFDGRSGARTACRCSSSRRGRRLRRPGRRAMRRTPASISALLQSLSSRRPQLAWRNFARGSSSPGASLGPSRERAYPIAPGNQPGQF
jgi:hypothetical protein